MSLLDELTKIHNRRAFYLLGEHALLDVRRSKKSLTVLFFDLNGLKTVNDSLGHEVGSRLLLEAATLLRSSFRASDVVARVGGDEFAVITNGRTEDLVSALQRLDDATAAANKLTAIPYRISYSMGQATADPESNESFAALVDRADALMYDRKRQRKLGREAATLQFDGGTPTIDTTQTGKMTALVIKDQPRKSGTKFD
jgi:diguanylate cyclase (GGDEF)-like protein